ncbi:MAG TPA: hypothetical protein VJ249_11725 [Candidatus Bathyarchaeia archaeon]|nr:hypothetical protein [Candidatus Bathyarchaeia archaeon]
MPKFKCKKCSKIAIAEFEACCDHPIGCTEKSPVCCGQSMIEVLDD